VGSNLKVPATELEETHTRYRTTHVSCAIMQQGLQGNVGGSNSTMMTDISIGDSSA
jgi:hypothetical protein